MAEKNSNTNEDGLRKGLWSIEEDMMLIEYVGRYGVDNWNDVQNNSGLLRCGQSCRLRWLNHLQPGIKKGAISDEEERTIMELHAMFGNKWAQMATQLPGRTDNEIKNFWNCRVKKLEKAGLPLYTPEALAKAEVYHQQQKEEQFQQLQQILSSPLFAVDDYLNNLGVLLPNQPTAANPLANHLDPTENYYFSPYPPSPPPPLPQFELRLSPVSGLGFHVSALNPSFAYVTGSTSEISATITATPDGPVTPVSSHSSEIDGWFEATSNMGNYYYEVTAPFLSPPRAGNTGLLGDTVLDAKNLSRNNKGKAIMADQDDADEGTSNTVKKNNAEATNENQSSELSNFQFSPGANPIGDYDELCSLINFSALIKNCMSWLFGDSGSNSDVSK
ncbi:transcription factor MYB101-like [Lotus japonicus]|uniref:transcription factor MYB101-like n=1 Tax=Lotus japonicus TaxID=34305 RepID=UPI00258BBFEE|nr:transcription factor MYB101-like [Lotus japonicus]